MKNINSKKKVALGFLGIAVIALIANTCYGYTFKKHIITQALHFEYPPDGKTSEYTYFAGHFQTTLSYDNLQAYEDFIYSLYGPGVIYQVSNLNEKEMESFDFLPLPPSSDIVAAIKFYAELPPMDVCGVALRTGSQTLLYVLHPIRNGSAFMATGVGKGTVLTSDPPTK